MKHEQLPGLLTLTQLSSFLQVPEKTIYNWVSLGKIPHLKVGRHLRFQQDKVLKYYEKLTEPRGKSRACLASLHPVESAAVSDRSLKIEAEILPRTRR